MTDRELLERAAKAAGIWAVFIPTEQLASWMKEETPSGRFIVDGRYWNPLTDDGDALRLAVKLKMDVQTNEASASVQTWQSDIGETKEVIEYFDYPQDSYAATRRAIVRAAAEIGKEMP